jgi:dynein intermediate chain 3, axonemal
MAIGNGIFPLFLRGATCEKYGFKTGEGVMDLVPYKLIPKDELMKEIQGLGVMSDFEPAKKYIESYLGNEILIIVDKEQKCGEIFAICYTEATKEQYLNEIKEQLDAIEAQRKEEEEIELARQAAEWARLNVVYEDKPLSSREWVTLTSGETDHEVKSLSNKPSREKLILEITRPKNSLGQKYKFLDRDSDVSGVLEFRSHKDPHFVPIRQAEIGLQAAPSHVDNSAQTTWYRPVNKAIQYTSSQTAPIPSYGGDEYEEMCSSLEKSIFKIEKSLQQNETLDIFNEIFSFLNDEEILDGSTQTENELRELKNFADPTYSKFKILSAIDWMPRIQGMVAVSAIKQVNFDQRVLISGQTNVSYLLLWDFRQLVRPQILLQSPHDILSFRFNSNNSNLVAGGTISGQVILWDISETIQSKSKKTAGAGGGGAGTGIDSSGTATNITTGVGATTSGGGGALPVGLNLENDDDNNATSDDPICIPKYISNVDHSHKRAVSDLFWLPSHVQINYRGQLVTSEYLDSNCYQFVTVAGDGQILVWDIRYEQIGNDELRHIGRAKHVPVEKVSVKEGGTYKHLWTPIFRAHLKRMEGVGELSICRAAYCPSVSQPMNLRSQILLSTEEGDILSADLSGKKGGGGGDSHKDDEDEEGTDSNDFVRWMAIDHSRPAVCLHISPFFNNIVLSVSDWNFHIWKIGEDKPLFTSPMSASHLTAGSWSPTRPAVLVVACADGSLMAWDFTDSSYRPSVEMKATHTRITSMEFLASSNINSRQQLLAVGDESGTLHIFEIPRNITRTVHREEAIMSKFLDRELQVPPPPTHLTSLSPHTLLRD